MLIFAFTVLSFLLLAVAGTFAFLYVRKDFQTQRQNDRRRERKHRYAMAQKLTQLEAAMRSVSVKDVPGTGGLLGVPPFARAEARVAREMIGR